MYLPISFLLISTIAGACNAKPIALNDGMVQFNTQFFIEGSVAGPMSWFHIRLKVDFDKVMKASKTIEASMRNAFKNLKKKYTLFGYQEILVEHMMDEVLNTAEKTRGLLFPDHQDPEKNRSSTPTLDRPKRQLGTVMAAAALGLGVYNQYEIGQLQSEFTEDHERVVNLAEEFGSLAENMAGIMRGLSTAQAEELFKNHVRSYHHFWTRLEKIYYAAHAGNLLPTFNSKYFNLTNALANIGRKLETAQCNSQIEEVQLLSNPVTVVRSKNAFSVLVGVPCIKTWNTLYKWNRHQRFYDPKSDKLWKIVMNERFFIESIVDQTGESKINDIPYYGAMEPADLQLCQLHSGNWYCPRMRVQEKAPETTCLGALWSSNGKAILEQCEFKEEKKRTSFVRLAANTYRFFGKQHVKVFCGPNNTAEYMLNRNNITLEPGCRVETDEVLITHLPEEYVTEQIHMFDISEWNHPFTMVNYNGLLNQMEKWTPKAHKHQLYTNHLVTGALLIFVVLSVGIAIFEGRKRKAKSRQRKARKREEANKNTNIRVTFNADGERAKISPATPKEGSQREQPCTDTNQDEE